MRRHELGVSERAARFEIGGNAGGAEFLLQMVAAKNSRKRAAGMLAGVRDDARHEHRPTGTTTLFGSVVRNAKMSLVVSPSFTFLTEVRPHLHPCQMRKGKGGEMETAGDYVAVVTASGASVSDSKETAYRRVKTLHIPGGVSVRDDIGERLSKQLPILHEHGYAIGMDY